MYRDSIWNKNLVDLPTVTNLVRLRTYLMNAKTHRIFIKALNQCLSTHLSVGIVSLPSGRGYLIRAQNRILGSIIII